MSSDEKQTMTSEEPVIKNSSFEMYFVEATPIGSVGRQPEAMQSAFTRMKTFLFTANWIKEDEVLEKEWSDNSDKLLFILDSFGGKAFDYLLGKKLRIVSPLTILFCYSKECPKRFKTIPIKPFPVFSQCMRKLFISMSGIDGERKQKLILKMTRMCGNFCKDFTKCVTHLVTDSVRTKKYKAAKQNRVPVLSSLWIDYCWDELQHNLIRADDTDIINKYSLKIFNNLLISVSRIGVDERKSVERLVVDNGGRYSPSLKLNEQNAMLLLRTPEGDKFKYAHLRGVPCLNIQWLYDSIDKGYALPEEDYVILPSNQSSQQKSEELSQQNGSKPSDDNQMATNQSSDSTILETTCGSTSKITENLSQEQINKLKANKESESYLEGLDIFIAGFEGPDFETIKSWLISNGSMVYNEFKSIVTHVIVGPNCVDTELEKFFDNKSCKVVSIEWFYECVRQRECCDTTPFEVKNPKLNKNNDSSGALKRKRKANDIFGGPLNVALPKRAHKALEKWKEESKIDAKHNHKSLGEKNKMNLIDWKAERGTDDEGKPSQTQPSQPQPSQTSQSTETISD